MMIEFIFQVESINIGPVVEQFHMNPSSLILNIAYKTSKTLESGKLLRKCFSLSTNGDEYVSMPIFENHHWYNCW